jgi:hypothetical protein
MPRTRKDGENSQLVFPRVFECGRGGGSFSEGVRGGVQFLGSRELQVLGNGAFWVGLPTSLLHRAMFPYRSDPIFRRPRQDRGLSPEFLIVPGIPG